MNITTPAAEWLFGATLLLFFSAGCSHSKIAQPAPEPIRCAAVDHHCYESIIRHTDFVDGTPVVWYPELPTVRDQILLIYNTQSRQSRFREVDHVSVQYSPMSAISSDNKIQTMTMERKLEHGANGFLYTRLEPGAFHRQGFIIFSSKNKPADNHYGSPWKIAIVESLPEYKKIETPRFNFFYLKDDEDTQRSLSDTTQLLNAKLDKIETATQLQLSQKFDYYYYPSRKALQEYQANQGNNFEEYRRRVYSSESRQDMHEITHLLFSQIGHNIGLLNEGLAVHYGQELVSDGWQNHPCDWWATKFGAEGTLPRLQQLITPANFYMHDWSLVGGVHYPVACSFVGYLIRKNGIAKFKKLFSSLTPDNQDNEKAVLSLFPKIYDKSLMQLENDWRQDLNTILSKSNGRPIQ